MKKPSAHYFLEDLKIGIGGKKSIFDFFFRSYFRPPENLKTYFKALFVWTPKKVHKISFSYQSKIILVF